MGGRAQVVRRTLPVVVLLAVGSVAPTAGPSALKTRFGDGTWAIGRQVAAGTYQTKGAHGLQPGAIYIDGMTCYWELDRRGPPGGEAGGVGSDIVAGPDIVTLPSEDSTFTAHGCGTWSPLHRAVEMSTNLGPGVYAVGLNMAPGVYHTRGTDGVMGEAGGSICLWWLLRDFTGGPRSARAAGNPSGPATVTIGPSDKGFETQGCYNWRLVHRLP